MPIKVCHLISSIMLGDGPSGGIFSQIMMHKSSILSEVWSLSAPPVDRDPREKLEELNIGYRTFNMRGFRDISMLFRITKALKEAKPDILHCHLVRANLYGRIAARMAGTPFVLNHLRNVEEYMFHDDLLSMLTRAGEKLTFKFVDYYIANCEGVRKAAIKLLKMPPEKVITILNATDLSPFSSARTHRSSIRAQLGIESDAVVVGSVGRLHRQKNFELLINVASRLRRNYPSLRFLIIGDGPERQRLMSRIQNLGVSDIFKVLGFSTDIPRLLQTFDIFAMPSRYEGLPRAAIEAQACGIPCILSDVGGNAEVVENGVTGYIVPESNECALALAIESLAKDPVLRSRMGETAERRASALFSPGRMTQETERLYAMCCGESINARR